MVGWRRSLRLSAEMAQGSGVRKPYWGKVELVGCSIWAEMGVERRVRLELELGVSMAGGNGVLGGLGERGGLTLL
jgi:hypothetical protein